MPKSWLSKARKGEDIGVYDQGKDEASEIRAETKQLQTLRRPLPIAPDLHQFFGSRMHDSWVISAERTDKQFRLTLDSINADIFAIDLANFLDLETKPTQWPVDLCFHNPAYIRAARVDLVGNLRFADWKKMKSNIPQRGNQFLYDWFYEQDGRLQWIADIWSPQKESHKLSSSILLMIDCTNVSVIDHRARAMEKTYGPAARKIWESAIGIPDPENAFQGLWGWQQFNTFIQHQMETNNFTRSDFQ